MIARAGNIFADLPTTLAGERVDAFLSAPGLRIERIVSTGQASPEGFWYDQPEDEWVIVLSGSARLLVEGEAEPRLLRPGDWLHLQARLRHRVEWTDPDRPTVWLAMHFKAGAAP